MLKAFRVLHLYTGVFIAPAVLFFAFSGALQTFGKNDPDPATGYKPAHWLSAMAQLHKKQTLTLPVRKAPAPAVAAKPADGAESAPVAAAPKPAAAPAGPTPMQPMGMKYFFAIVAWGLFMSTATGIYMAYKYRRNPVGVTVALVLGVVVPLVLLKFS